MLNAELSRKIISLSFFFAAAVSAGETINYTGRIYADRAADLMPMGNGNGAMVIQAAGIAAMSASGSPPSVFGLGCVGLGLVSNEGKADSDVYCTFKENDSDWFDIKGRVKEGEGSFDVIGGSGKYEAATGTGKYTRMDKTVDETKDGGLGILELQIRTK